MRPCCPFYQIKKQLSVFLVIPGVVVNLIDPTLYTLSLLPRSFLAEEIHRDPAFPRKVRSITAELRLRFLVNKGVPT